MSFCFCVFWGLQNAALDYAHNTKKQKPCLFVCFACSLARCFVEELGAQSHYIPAGVFRIFWRTFVVVILWRIIFNLLCALEEIHFVKILQEIGRWVCCWKKKKPKPCLHEKLFLFFSRWFLVVENIPSEQHVLCLELYRLSWFFRLLSFASSSCLSCIFLCAFGW